MTKNNQKNVLKKEMITLLNNLISSLPLLLREPLPFLILFLILILSIPKQKSLRTVIRKSKEISVEKFLEMRNEKEKGKRLASGKVDEEGVYILYNRTKRKYYVGQAKHIVSRVNNHLTGKGNGILYADYVHGDRFTVRFVPLKGSGEKSLNALERKYIDKYKAREKGYNRTKGNFTK